MPISPAPDSVRFGHFDLSPSTGELRLHGNRLKVQPQPFKLLILLVRHAGTVVSRDEIRQELWPDGTFVDFDQAVNFAIKQVRDVLRDHADRPIYIETVPRRGYRFIAPVETSKPRTGGETSVRLQKALWQNVAELRLAEVRRRKYTVATLSALTVLIVVVLTYLVLR
jgi:DNA-binding winged helix-turn-helix (wHTH) protein